MKEVGPSLFFGPLEIAEFTGTLTDILLALLSFYFAKKLQSMKGESGSRNLLVWHFTLLGLSTLIGGLLGHSFLYYFGMAGKIPGWVLSLASVYALELVVLRLVGAHIPKKFYLFSAALASSLFIATTLVCFMSTKYLWVALHNAFGLLLIVGGFGIYMIRKDLFKNVFSYFWIGIGLSALAATVFGVGISIHTWFNYMDLSHVIIGFATWCNFLGAKELLKQTHDNS